ncbi:MAG: histone family protein [Candidatus Aenigmatarchaeota archaeon]
MGEIPLAPVDRIIRSQGAKRVSEEAVKEFSEVIEEIAGDLAAESAALAEHAGRKTVKGEDVRLASRKGF